MKYPIYLAFAGVLVLAGCNSSKKLSDQNATQVISLDTLDISASSEPPVYRASETRTHDLLHTELHVQFDWKNQHLLGQATLSARPYFQPTSEFTLDARGFDIHQVALVVKDSLRDTLINLTYTYEDPVLTITLNKTYRKSDTFNIFIDYTAKPNELKEGGSAAIRSDKGLYFINPVNEEKDKPQQIWTQGETESNSAWFPTIDSPNERMTQDLYITVEERFHTLSNGKLILQTQNKNGTRTDYWSQKMPHAPYLVMMAIGEFSVVKDKWRDLEVDYYVESEFEPHAKAIFGNTPEMLEFYSNLLGVPYPWEKYHQVVVRDYVSGAMENTSAVIHGEFLQQTPREMLDGDNEDVIAHELFHHWFGDLVTCESWSNIPLNESFATYGEYLWIEYKYGREEADQQLQADLSQYLGEARSKREDLIRFYYDSREQMFDRHSYSKGGRVLHMLRKELGDNAFFASLEHYLKVNQYRAVEIHDLRLAFEEVTGQDLNWFFNQWFLASGHPELEITYDYDSTKQVELVTIRQMQDLTTTPLYRLPVEVDVYGTNAHKKHRIVITKKKETFEFQSPSGGRPLLVNVDAEKMLLGTINDKKSRSAWIYQYEHAPLYLDRYEAVSACIALAEKDSVAAGVVKSALNDPYHNIRRLAARSLKDVVAYYDAPIRAQLIELAGKDEESNVRATALNTLQALYPDEALAPVYEKALKDQSYLVMASGLGGLGDANPKAAMKAAKQLESVSNTTLTFQIAAVYAEHGSNSENAFFEDAFDNISGFGRINLASSYGRFLANDKSDEVVNKGLVRLMEVAQGKQPWFVRYYGVEAIKNLDDKYREKEHDLNKDITVMESKDQSDLQLEVLRTVLDKVKQQRQHIGGMISDIKASEKNATILRLLGGS